MRAPHSAHTQQTVFAIAVPTAIVTMGVAAVLLDPGRAEDLPLMVSGALLLVTGLVAGLSCAYRARLTSGRRRRAWGLFAGAAVVAFLSNVVSAAAGTDPVEEPSLVSDLGVVVALLLCIAGLVSIPAGRRSGAGQVMSVLDGLVAGGGMIAMASVLVYPQLLASQEIGSAQLATALLIPVLDVVLLTVALILFTRATGSGRWSLLLIATGFGVYAVADLGYAVQVAEGFFDFGTRLDLGWILGYLLIGLAALHPGAAADDPRSETPSDTRGAILVFVVLTVAGVVQVRQGDQLSGPLAALWLCLVMLAGIRLTMLSRVNDALRRGLERRVQAQTADLARLVAEKEQLLTSVGDGIYGVDREGRITFVNPSGAAALGLRPRDLLGRDAHATFHAGDDDHPRTECYVHCALRSARDVSEVEDTYRRAGGATFPVEVTANPVVEEGETRGAVVVFRDVTQRREVEQMKNDFLSVVSHELRTPLTSIRGSLGLLAGGALGPLEPRVSKLVTVAAESSERLTRLIDDLLDMERIVAGGRTMRLAALDAETVVRAAVEQMRGAGLPRDIMVTAGPCTGRMLADEDQVLQTLTNLLGNAIKFSEPGGRVVASARAEDGHVVFRVRDEGRGIPSDKLALIFEPFAQVDSSDAREKDGTGLGLAICRAIVESHGGRIWAESRDRQGTTMLFTLPAATRGAALAGVS
ncbi:MAG: ATP-binding protein [Nocardioides sp.]